MQTFDGNGMNGDIEKRMAAYASMSESALVGELKREADALKSRGFWTSEDSRISLPPRRRI